MKLGALAQPDACGAAVLTTTYPADPAYNPPPPPLLLLLLGRSFLRRESLVLLAARRSPALLVCISAHAESSDALNNAPSIQTAKPKLTATSMPLTPSILSASPNPRRSARRNARESARRSARADAFPVARGRRVSEPAHDHGSGTAVTGPRRRSRVRDGGHEYEPAYGYGFETPPGPTYYIIIM